MTSTPRPNAPTPPPQAALTQEYRRVFAVLLAIGALLVAILPAPANLVVLAGLVLGGGALILTDRSLARDLVMGIRGTRAIPLPTIRISARLGHALEIGAVLIVLWGATWTLQNWSPEWRIKGPEFSYLINNGAIADRIYDLSGSIPLWNPFMGRGEPLLESPFGFVLNPLMTLPMFWFGSLYGSQIAVLLHIGLMGIGGWVLGYVLGLRAPARILAALLMGGAGGMAGAIGYGFYQMSLSQAYMPWIYAGLFGTIYTKSRRWVAVLAAAAALQMFAGTFWYVLPTALGCALIVLFHLVRRSSRGWFIDTGMIVRLIWAGALLIGISAVRFIPQVANHNMIAHPRATLDTVIEFATVATPYFVPEVPKPFDNIAMHYQYIMPPLFAAFLLVGRVWAGLRRNTPARPVSYVWRVILPSILMIIVFTGWAQEGTPVLKWITERIPTVGEWRFLGRMLAASAPFFVIIAAIWFDDIWVSFAQPLIARLKNGERSAGGIAVPLRIGGVVAAGALIVTVGVGGTAAADVTRNWERMTGLESTFTFERPMVEYLRERYPDDFLQVWTGSFFVYLPFYDTLTRAAFGNPDYRPYPMPSTIGTPEAMDFPPEHAIGFESHFFAWADWKGYTVMPEAEDRFNGDFLYENPDAPTYVFAVHYNDIAERTLPLTRYEALPVDTYTHHIDWIEVTIGDYSPGFIVVAQELAFPGWSAEINGQPATLESVGGLIGVRLPDKAPGSPITSVIFRYEPPLLHVSGALTVFSVGVFAVYALRLDRVVRRRPSEQKEKAASRPTRTPWIALSWGIERTESAPIPPVSEAISVSAPESAPIPPLSEAISVSAPESAPIPPLSEAISVSAPESAPIPIAPPILPAMEAIPTPILPVASDLPSDTTTAPAATPAARPRGIGIAYGIASLIAFGLMATLAPPFPTIILIAFIVVSILLGARDVLGGGRVAVPRGEPRDGDPSANAPINTESARRPNPMTPNAVTAPAFVPADSVAMPDAPLPNADDAGHLYLNRIDFAPFFDLILFPIRVIWRSARLAGIVGVALLFASTAYWQDPRWNEVMPQAFALMLVGMMAIWRAAHLNGIAPPILVPTVVRLDRASPVWIAPFAFGVLLLALVAEISGNRLQIPNLSGAVSTRAQFVMLAGGVALMIWGLGGAPTFKLRFHPRQWDWLLIGITILGLGLRLWDLDWRIRVLIDELHVSDAIRQLWADANIRLLTNTSGLAPFTWIYPYWNMELVNLFGASFNSLRSLSVILGTLAIPATYFFARHLFDRKTGLIAALIIACMAAQIHWSRVAAFLLADPLMAVIGMGFFARALKTNRRIDWAAGGAFIGMSSYFYEGGRLTFTALAFLWVLGLIVVMPGRLRWLRAHWRGLLIFYLALLLMIAPVYYTMWASNTGIAMRLDSQALGTGFFEQYTADGINVYDLLEIGTRFGTPFLTYVAVPPWTNFPAVNPTWTTALFLVGVALLFWRLRYPSLVLLGWLAATALGNGLLQDSTSQFRFTVVWNAVAITTALGVRYAWSLIVPVGARWIERAQAWRATRSGARNWIAARGLWVRRALPLLLVLSVAGGTVWYYFVPYLTFYNTQVRGSKGYRDGTDAALRAASLPDNTAVYIIGRPEHDQTVPSHFLTFLTTGADGLATFDPHEMGANTLMRLPRDRNYAFFVDPDDSNYINLIRLYFPNVQPPQYSDYPYLPPSEQYILLYAPQADYTPPIKK